MKGLVYLYQKSIINRIKRALKKPVTYIFLVFIVLYAIAVIGSFGTLIEELQIGNSQSLAVILSSMIFFLLPANFISYSRRKGLLFKKSDIHFIFPSPVNPKVPILFTGMLNLWINLGLVLFTAFMGIRYFHVNPLQMLLYAILYLIFENLLEAGMMILCYGNETLPKRFFTVLTGICYGIMALFIIVAILLMAKRGFAFSIFTEYLELPIIQMIPIIGWNIAMIRMVFVGPTLLNIICTLLFLISSTAIFLLALKSKCVGEYYEDAATFADNYAKLKERKQKGIVDVSMGKKKKFKKANIEYKGGGAKAIFYRQILEYKKTKFFIFGFNTLISFVIGVGLAVLAFTTDMESEFGVNKIFIIPGVMAYIIFILSSYATKWSQELENPYTFLIPDNSLKKLWYATKIEHIRAIVDGFLMAVPGAIVMGLSVVQTLLIVLLYVCLMANKLYYFMVADFLIGRLLGNIGRTLVKLFLQGIAIGISVGAAVVGGIFLGVEAGFAIMIVATFVFTFFGALIAALSFEKMEVID